MRRRIEEKPVFWYNTLMSVNDLTNLGNEADASDEVRRLSARAEDEIVLRQVGLVPNDLDANIWNDAERRAMSTTITTNIIAALYRTRSRLTAARLNGLLDQGIQNALESVAQPPNGIGGRETVARVLAQAMYDALPKETWHVVVEQAINNAYTATNDREEAMKFYEKLRSDNDANDMSAGMAVLMAMRDPAVAPVANPSGTPPTESWQQRYIQAGDRAGIQGRIDGLKRQKNFHDAVDSVKSEAVRFTYPHVSTYSDSLAENANLGQDASRAYSTSTSWASAGMTALYRGETPDTLLTPDEKRAKAAAATALRSDLKNDLESYQKLERQLQSLMDKAQSLFVNPALAVPDLVKYFTVIGTAYVINPATLVNTLNMAVISAEIAANLAVTPPPVTTGGPLVASGALPVQISEQERNLSNAKDEKDISGTDVQRSVFRSYVKREQPGLSDADVDQVATHISNRSKVDGALRTSVNVGVENYLNVGSRTMFDSVSDSMHNWGTNEWTSRVGSTLAEIAKSLNIPVAAGGQPNWQAASYDQAVGAYFAIKELMDGKGPDQISFARRPLQAVQSLRTLSNIMTTRYVGQIENNLLNSLSAEEKKKVLKSRGKTSDLMKQFLLGDTPAWVKPNVEKALKRADGHASWFLRATYDLPFKAVDAAYSTGSWLANAGISGVSSAVSHYGADAAKIAAFSFLGGPVLGIAAWYAMKHFEKPSSAKE